MVTPGISPARIKLRAVTTASDEQFDRQRLQSWERNEIDDMGRDAFENIKKRLDRAITVDLPPEGKQGPKEPHGAFAAETAFAADGVDYDDEPSEAAEPD